MELFVGDGFDRKPDDKKDDRHGKHRRRKRETPSQKAGSTLDAADEENDHEACVEAHGDLGAELAMDEHPIVVGGDAAQHDEHGDATLKGWRPNLGDQELVENSPTKRREPERCPSERSIALHKIIWSLVLPPVDRPM
jgi:hypothetical protein